MGERVWDRKELAVYITAEANLHGMYGDSVPYYWVREDDQQPVNGWIKIHAMTVEIPRPRKEEVLPQQVAAFEEEIRKTRVEAEEKVVKLQEQLENLLAIGYESAQPAGQNFDDSIPF